MRLSMKMKTNAEDLTIEFLELQLKSGDIVTIDYDSSEYYTKDRYRMSMHKGVCMDEEYLNGRLNELEGIRVTDVGLYSEKYSSIEFELVELTFDDEGKTLTFTDGYRKNRSQ